eukprot:gene14817-14951_t
MVSRIVTVEPFDLIVFGGTGDLAYRKLFPAMFRRDIDHQFTEPTRIIGISRKEMAIDDFKATVLDALKKFVTPDALSPEALERFLARIDYVAVDAKGEHGWDSLQQHLAQDPEKIRAYYLATSPDLFGPIAAGLARKNLVTQNSRIIVEKPIGKDGASAAAINDALGAVFSEKQIYRIDHYLGKETVQNLMALRFANALFEPIWNSAHIDHVQITAAESIGVEGRGPYYDNSGAMRDMVQNHLLQLLCLVAMEPPSSLDADSVRDEKLKVLKSLVPITEANAANLTVRGQYRAGVSESAAVPGYLEELGRDSSSTETFVALKVNVANWRFAGVPFYVRSGKRMPQRVSEITIVFKPVPFSIFGASVGSIPPNRLVIRLQPDEGIKLWLMIKEPGPGGVRLQHVPLDMSFATAFDGHIPEAYERLLMDVIRGNATLFMRRDEVEAAWRFIDPIREAWAHINDQPRPYVAGTWGPVASIALVERDGRTWNEDLE